MSNMYKYLQTHFANSDTYPFIHKQLTVHILQKYLCEEVNTAEISYFKFNDLLQGKYTEWSPNGKMRKQCTYVDGELHGEYKFWYMFDGPLWIQCTYRNGVMDGKYTRWHDNGHIQTMFTYANGEKNGECKMEYGNGQLWMQFSHLHDERHGMI